MAIDERERPVLEILDKMGIRYKRYEHPYARTMQNCEGIGAEIGAKHFKNLFLCSRNKAQYCLLLIAADKPFRTGMISKRLGVSRLSFCSDAQLMDKLGLLPGSVTPMALWHENAKDILVAIDEEIKGMELVCVHPCTANASLAISFDDLMKFIRAMGNPVQFISIERPAVPDAENP